MADSITADTEVRKPRTFVFNSAGRLDRTEERDLLADIKPVHTRDVDSHAPDTARYERGSRHHDFNKAGSNIIEKSPIQELVTQMDSKPPSKPLKPGGS